MRLGSDRRVRAGTDRCREYNVTSLHRNSPSAKQGELSLGVPQALQKLLWHCAIELAKEQSLGTMATLAATGSLYVAIHIR